MRLRQVALVSSDLDRVTDQLNKVFGLKVAYNDPHIHVYGLKNAVLPAGAGFLEVVQPVVETASAARHLKRRGGDAGYMVILQVSDAPAEAARAAGEGVRIVDTIDTPDYYAAHFHPADFGGMLVSFDQQRSEPDLDKVDGDWMPAGPEWRSHQSDQGVDLRAVTLSSPDPEALAARWAQLLAQPLDTADPLRLPLGRGEVRFAASDEGAPTLIESLDIAVREPAASRDRATKAGLDMADDAVLIGGVRWRAISL
mgnify:CR=1 FL=1